MPAYSKINYKALSINTVLFLMILYFILHSLNGERGVFAYIRLNSKLKEQHSTLIALVLERQNLEKQVHLLHPKTLDLDLLDEIARRDLGLISDTEKVLYLEKKHF